MNTKPLVFSCPDAAIQFAGEFLDCNLRDGACLPVVVDDVDDSIARIRYPSPDGPKQCLAGFPEQVHYPASFIACLCLAQFAVVPGSGPVALVVSEIKPEFVPSSGWAIKEKFV
ncbi:hypothetical protein [Methyloversatilis discipulorum]|uniref:hypothetical protein n=1 Tax=Methyloversatilis discipulorum TaxID=1119528 RepID=UPI0012FBDBED|nr:hypothetical protein [Methyloversatilis discipulorum]